jgi:outer membrane lipoprotein carrier protein
MKFFYRFTHLNLMLLLLSLATVAYASTAENELISLLTHLQRARADFFATLTDGEGKIIQQTSGQMTLKRPGRFRWEIKRPNKQLLIADGQRVWFYDIDLQQIIVQKQQTVSANSPAALLSDATVNLAKQFSVQQLGNKQGFQLIPKDKNAMFQSIILVFQGNFLREMRLSDKLGQQTEINFTHFVENPLLNLQDFHFVIPKNKNIEIVKA